MPARATKKQTKKKTGAKTKAARRAGAEPARASKASVGAAVRKSSGAPAWRNEASMYGVHPGVAMVQEWIETMKAKTGRSLDEWLRFIKKEGPKDSAARREWLKKTHGVGTNKAWWLVERAEGQGPWDDDPEMYLRQAVGYVRDMYAGGKEGLRPIHMRLVALALSLGKDVTLCPCATIVPVYRKNVIAQIKPRTRTALDFGFALGPTKATGRLIDTGGFAKKDRITHRIELTAPEQVDAEVERWLRKAYEMNAERGKMAKRT